MKMDDENENCGARGRLTRLLDEICRQSSLSLRRGRERERERERGGAGVKETEGLRCTVQGSGRKDGGGVLLPFSVSSPFQALCGLWECTTLVCF